MYAKGKGSTVPSDAQAREKLALYVYEYLLHVGAQKAAQTFLTEIRWEKNITLGKYFSLPLFLLLNFHVLYWQTCFILFIFLILFTIYHTIYLGSNTNIYF